MKQTIRDLALYLGKAESTMYAMKKAHPKQFNLLWLGWVELLQSNKRE